MFARELEAVDWFSACILGVDHKRMEMSMDEFLGYVRQNYLVGEPLTLNVLRNGKRVDLKVTLK